MFGNPFYNESLRKTVVAFGSLFNEIYVQRKETIDGKSTAVEQIRVPLTYTGKEKFRMMLRQFESIEQDVGSILPRMGFSMTTLTYDPTRKRNTMQKRLSASSSPTTSLKYDYAEVPYNVEFELNIAVRNMDDGLQIIEQIVPNFTPDFTVSVNFTEIHKKIDVPIVLTGVVDSIEAEGELDEPRIILFTLTFTAGTNIYTKPRESGVITKAIADVSNGGTDFAAGFTGQFFQSVVEATDITDQRSGGFGITSHHTDFAGEAVKAYEARSGVYIFELPDLYKEPGSAMGSTPRMYLTTNGTADGVPITGKGRFHLYADIDATPAGSPPYTPGQTFNNGTVPTEANAGETIGYEMALAILVSTGYREVPETGFGVLGGTGGQMTDDNNRFQTFLPTKSAHHIEFDFDTGSGATFEEGGATFENKINFEIHIHEDASGVGEGAPGRLVAENLRLVIEMDEPKGLVVDSNGIGNVSNSWLLQATGNSGWFAADDNVFREIQTHSNDEGSTADSADAP